ncbi:MAG: putative topoisomerase [Ilumatobacteraceae bacterium]|nr:putative topoisomerase [Ilumatobacteraceae bacterium]
MGAMVATSHPAEAARAAGLTYVSDVEPGIRRLRAGKGFRYVGPNGTPTSVRNKARIAALVIPPAWQDVWICPSPKGHIQAVGRDDAGRKQYLYHPGWTEARDAEKFENLAAFGRRLPRVRDQVAKDLALRGLPRERVLALVARLLDETLIRVGNDASTARDSFGLTTIESRHVEVRGSAVAFEFTGKSSVEHQIELRDQQLAKLISACDEADGPQLFCYLDGDDVVDVTADDVNAYLRAAGGRDVSARDFRTWGGTVTAVQDLGPLLPEDRTPSAFLAAVDVAAERLGNTRTVCRASYIHPAIEPAFHSGELSAAWSVSRRSNRYTRAERTTMRLLDR